MQILPRAAEFLLSLSKELLPNIWRNSPAWCNQRNGFELITSRSGRFKGKAGQKPAQSDWVRKFAFLRRTFKPGRDLHKIAQNCYTLIGNCLMEKGCSAYLHTGFKLIYAHPGSIGSPWEPFPSCEDPHLKDMQIMPNRCKMTASGGESWRAKESSAKGFRLLKGHLHKSAPAKQGLTKFDTRPTPRDNGCYL